VKTLAWSQHATKPRRALASGCYLLAVGCALDYKPRAMMKERIRELLNASPFVPFTIEMASGKNYHVEHHDFVLAGSDSADIVVQDPNGLMQILNPMLITTILLKPMV
jgi:hypothetical protein